ncbi:hypothetical protein GCM10009642_35580 [Nocardiopsis metallicus]
MAQEDAGRIHVLLIAHDLLDQQPRPGHRVGVHGDGDTGRVCTVTGTPVSWWARATARMTRSTPGARPDPAIARPPPEPSQPDPAL